MKKINITITIKEKFFGRTFFSFNIVYALGEIGLRCKKDYIYSRGLFFGPTSWKKAVDVPNYYNSKNAEKILQEYFDWYVKNGEIKFATVSIMEEESYNDEDTGLNSVELYPLGYDIYSKTYQKDIIKSIIDFDYFVNYDCNNEDEIVDMVIQNIINISGVKEGTELLESRCLNNTNNTKNTKNTSVDNTVLAYGAVNLLGDVVENIVESIRNDDNDNDDYDD